ncbi:MAG: IS1096 element passenger TnpR family protein [Mangrovibacterium sp.]
MNSDDTFADLHRLLQNNCCFEPNQLASFFISGTNCGQKTEITQLDMGWDKPHKLVMDRTPLQQVLAQKNQKLCYVFDFFTDRLLNIELTQIFMGTHLSEPSVIYQNGSAPSQMLEEEIKNEEQIITPEEACLDYGDLDDYTEIFGETFLHSS